MSLEYKIGDYLYCIKNLVMNGTRTVEYTKGKIYISESSQCITDNSKDKNHGMEYNTTSDYFRFATEDEIKGTKYKKRKLNL